ncbi:MAG: SUMF1/EgtB/PvdO family nonheme iron enzyme [Elusimicrobiota bacterium]
MKKGWLACAAVIVIASAGNMVFPGNSGADMKNGNGIDESTPGIVTVPLAWLYRDPSAEAEILTQAMYGDTVKVIEEQPGWVKLTLDSQGDYLGWVEKEAVYTGKKVNEYLQKINKRQVLVIDTLTDIFVDTKTLTKIVENISAGVILPFESEQTGWFKVLAPVGKNGYTYGYVSSSAAVVNTRRELTEDEVRANIVTTAKKYMAIPYVWGANSSKGFDCSGFTYSTYRQNGIIIPRDCRPQCAYGTIITREELKPGDAVYFTTYRPGASHTGIYAGNGNFIHASTKNGITVGELNDEYYQGRFFGARRFLPDSDPETPEILIPAGKFIMGSNTQNGNERPEHEVYLNAYYIDKYEVTNREYTEFVNATNYQSEGKWDKNNREPGHPVLGVTWNDAGAYAKWAGKRLPTEAEWEKAARGTAGRRFPWGNLWYANRAQTAVNASLWATAVNANKDGRSVYGCYNMAGNAWEWCEDWYDEKYYTQSPRENPVGPKEGMYKICRGGGWDDLQDVMHSSYRGYFEPKKASQFVGFRCARSLIEK